MAVIFLFSAAFAVLDRAWGSSLRFAGRSGHSLATVGALLMAIACWFVLHNPYAAALWGVWPIYRSLNFSGGAQAPETTEQAVAAFGRHAIMAGFMAAVVLVQHQALSLYVLPSIGYALVATGLAVVNGETRGNLNWALEALRGAAFGACATLALGLV